MGQPVVGTVDDDGGGACAQTIEEAFAQLADVGEALVSFAAGTIEGAGQADGEGDRLGAGPASLLLMTAPCPRPQLDATTHQQRADADGTVELVAADRQ